MTENIRYLNRINQLSEDDMRDYITLHRLLEVEMRKSPKDMDLDLIDECSAQIDELVGEGPKHSPAAMQAKIKEILGTPTSKASHISKKSRPVVVADKKNRHRARNFFIILAAALVLLYSSLAIAAKVQGYNNTWEFITQKFIEIFNLEAGESLEEGNITLVMDTERRVYSSIDEMLEKEDLNILYPSMLPDDVKITSVNKRYRNETEFSLIFFFSEETLSVVVKNYYTLKIEFSAEFEKIQLEKFDFYITQLDNGHYQTIFQLDGYEYFITHSSREELIKLIDNMKGQIP